MFSKELEVTISQAYQEARNARHEFLTVEHLLLALLENSSALSILSACGADINGLEKELRKALEDTVPVLKDEDSRDTQPTIGFQRVLQRALYQSRVLKWWITFPMVYRLFSKTSMAAVKKLLQKPLKRVARPVKARWTVLPPI
jgi:ATP-dependent Clp protease ATP-binding subunit ClpA